MLLVASASAAAGAMDLPALIGQADTATQVSVALVPSMMRFRIVLDENAMRRFACRFDSVDPAAIHALVALFEKAGLAVQPMYQKPDIREGVYLTLADGSRLSFFLQDNFGGRSPVIGVVESYAAGTLQSVAFTARSTLAGDVRDWASAQAGEGTGYACHPTLSSLPPVPQLPPVR